MRFYIPLITLALVGSGAGMVWHFSRSSKPVSASAVQSPAPKPGSVTRPAFMPPAITAPRPAARPEAAIRSDGATAEKAAAAMPKIQSSAVVVTEVNSAMEIAPVPPPVPAPPVMPASISQAVAPVVAIGQPSEAEEFLERSEEDVFREARSLLATDPLLAAQLASTLPAGRERTALVSEAFYTMGRQNAAEAVRIAGDTGDRELALAAYSNAMAGGMETGQIAVNGLAAEPITMVARAAAEGEAIPVSMAASAMKITAAGQHAGMTWAAEHISSAGRTRVLLQEQPLRAPLEDYRR